VADHMSRSLSSRFVTSPLRSIQLNGFALRDEAVAELLLDSFGHVSKLLLDVGKFARDGFLGHSLTSQDPSLNRHGGFPSSSSTAWATPGQSPP
jgi:hypothetical protein